MLPGFIDSHAHWIGDGSRVGHTADTAIDAAVRAGWTSVNEQFVDQGRLEELRALDAAGRLRVRVNAYLPVNFADEKFGHWFLEFEPRHAYSPRLRLAGIKLFLDHDWGTDFHWDQGELEEYVMTAHRNGWQVAAHTVSAEAHDQILTAVARAQAEYAEPDARHRVEHVIQLRDDQLTRMRELGVITSIEPGVPGDLAEEAGFPELVARGKTGWIARWRDLVDGGVRTIGSTDMPWLVLELVGGPTEPPHGSPLEAVSQAMTGRTYSDRPPVDATRAPGAPVDAPGASQPNSVPLQPILPWLHNDLRAERSIDDQADLAWLGERGQRRRVRATPEHDDRSGHHGSVYRRPPWHRDLAGTRPRGNGGPVRHDHDVRRLGGRPGVRRR